MPVLKLLMRMLYGLMLTACLACQNESPGSIRGFGPAGGFLSSGVEPSSEFQRPGEADDVSAFNLVEVSINESRQTLNHVATDVHSEPEKQADGTWKDVKRDNRARKIMISGIKVVLDPSREPFKHYQGRLNIDEVRVEAEEIIVKDAIQIPQSKIILIAEKIVFEEGAVIDVTPVDDFSSPAPLPNNPEVRRGNDAVDGLSGGTIAISARDFLVRGDLEKPRLLAQGGGGQRGGEGRPGQDGISSVSLGSTWIDGISYGTVFQAKCAASGTVWATGCLWRKCWKIKIGEWERRLEARGSDISVEEGNGQPAIPGGRPGAGGPGGEVQIKARTFNGATVDESDNPTPLHFVSVAAGRPGVSAGLYKGGRPGEPIDVIKEVCLDFDSETGHREPRFYHRSAGEDAISPERSERDSPAGVARLQGQDSGLALASPAFFRQKLLWIRHLYLTRQFAETQVELRRDLDRLQAKSETKSEFALIEANYGLLLKRLSLQQDYFGHSQRQAPLFELSFSLARYDSEVERSLRVFRLTSLILEEIRHRQENQFSIEKLIQQYDGTVAAETVQSADRERHLNELQNHLHSLQDQEKRMAQVLADLTAQIEKQAHAVVTDRHKYDRLKLNLRTMASIMKVIPAYQPALATLGSLADNLLEIPQSSDPAEWLRTLESAHGNLTTLTDIKNLRKSKLQLDDFLNKFRPTNLRNKSLSEKVKSLQSLYDEMAASQKQIRVLAEEFSRDTVPNDEIQTEIERIKTEDPILQEASFKLQQYLSEKVRTVELSSNLLQEILESSRILELSIRLSIASSNQLVDKSGYADSGLRMIVDQMRAESEERLLFLYEEVRRAYEYTSLDPAGFMTDLSVLRERVSSFVGSMTEADQLSALGDTYRTATNSLINALDQKFREGGGSDLILHQGVVTMALSFEQLQQLNATPSKFAAVLNSGSVEVPCDVKNFVSNQYNVRLASIEVAEVEFEFANAPKQGFGKLDFVVTPGSRGTLRDRSGREHVYEYLNNDLYAWVSSIDLSSGQLSKPESRVGLETQGILSILVGERHALFYSAFFAQPAAETSLRVETHVNGYLDGPPKLKSLKLKVHYSYSIK